MRTLIVALLAVALLQGIDVQAQELEPGVQTSSAAAPAPGKPSATSAAAPSTAAPAARSKSPGAGRSAAQAPAQASSPGSAGTRSTDRIQLDTTQISGNRELPKVMYVVPWRRADPGDFAGRPPNSLLDEALTPVDRDVFKRQNRYYGAVQDQAQSGRSQADASAQAPATSAGKDEK